MTTARQARATRLNRKLGEALAQAQADIASVRKPRLPASSYMGGIPQFDLDGNIVSQIGLQFDGTNAPTTLIGPTPPTPTPPTVSDVNVGSVSVTWDGSYTDAVVAPMDFARVELHLTNDDDPTLVEVGPASSTKAGEVNAASGGTCTVKHVPGDFFAWLVVCSQAGKYGPVSDPAAVHIDTPAADAPGDLMVAGVPLLGKLLDPNAPSGWLDGASRGVENRLYSFRGMVAGKTISDGGSLWAGQQVFTLAPGRLYRLEMPWQLSLVQTSASDSNYLSLVRLYMEQTTDGTTPPDPTTSSAAVSASPTQRWVGGANASNQPAGSGFRNGLIVGAFTPQATTNVKVALYLSNTRCSSLPVTDTPETFMVAVYDMGAAPAVLPAGPMGSAAVQTFTSTWTASDSRTYNSAGAVLNYANTASPNTASLFYGDASKGGNVQKSVVLFNGKAVAGEVGKTIAQALAGGTVSKIEVRFWANYWQMGSGQLKLRKFTGSAFRGTETTSAADAKLTGRAAYDYTSTGWGQWWTLPDTTWVTATNRGIYLDTADWTVPNNHGTFDGSTGPNPAQVRFTYTRNQ